MKVTGTVNRQTSSNITRQRTGKGESSRVAESYAAEVSLVFPPLVDTNFGSYYSSTAMLAAFLSSHGIRSTQRDLNEEFAEHLLQTESLERMVTGQFCDSEMLVWDSMPVVAARILIRSRERLFDQNGRHLFQDRPKAPAYLLRTLARPYRIDVPLSELVRAEFYKTPTALWYESFFEQTNYAYNIEPTIRIVGISVAMGPQLAPSLILARWLKHRRPDLTIVFGGPTMSLMRLKDLETLLLANSAVDAVVRFDGEGPLLELVKQKQMETWAPQTVAGVSCRVLDKIIHRPPRAGPRLDELPYCEYDPTLMLRLADPELGITQARGCYWGKCAYCDYVELYDGSPPYRSRTPESFIDEMQFQQRKSGVTRFAIITESLPPAFARRVSELILSRSLNVRWTSFAMVDRRFDTDLLSLIARAGCDYLVVGLETMTDRVLRMVGKAATQAENIRFLREAKLAGLRLKINLIPDLPSTTYEEAMASLTLLQGLRDCLWSLSVFPFEATSSSAIGRSLGDYGLRSIDAQSRGQAQFALNHMDVEDFAMNPQQRKGVYSAYFTFADEVNSQRDQSGLAGPVIDDQTYLRVAHERLDFIERDDAVYCYDWASRQRFRMHKGWLRLLDTIDIISPFRRVDFLRQFPEPAVGDWLFAELQKNDLLEKEEQGCSKHGFVYENPEPHSFNQVLARSMQSHR